MIVAVAVAALAVAGIATAVGLAWRRSSRARASFEAAYQPLTSAWAATWCITIRAAFAVGAEPSRAQLGPAIDAALSALLGTGPWRAQGISLGLSGLRVLVRAETEWADAYGRTVAGLAYPTSQLVVVGADLAALAHELAELLYWRLEGAEDWQAREWAGRAEVEAACARYAELRRAA